MFVATDKPLPRQTTIFTAIVCAGISKIAENQISKFSIAAYSKLCKNKM